MAFENEAKTLQTAERTSDELCPPNPKLFNMATLTFASRAIRGTISKVHAGPGGSQLIVGWMTPCRIVIATAAAATLPPAPHTSQLRLFSPPPPSRPPPHPHSS